MIASIIGLVLVAVGLIAVALQRFYSSIPAKELRRLSARGDHLALALYRAVAYGASLRLFLWVIASAGLTGGIVLLSQQLAVWAAFCLIAAVLLSGFVLMQSVKLTVRTAGFAAAIAPAIGAVLGRLEPFFGKISHVAGRHRSFIAHSGLYEKEDLRDLLDQQKNQTDNRITHEELELARRALYFDDTRAGDAMIARPAMKTLKANDSIGPILLEELYKSGQRSFVVYDEASDNHALGVVQLQDAVNAKHGGKVSAIMDKDIVYAHEDFTLRQVADVCLKTSKSLVLVINVFEELVGAISLDMLLTELFGGPGGHMADLPYQDRATVAAFKAPVIEDAVMPDDTVQEPAPDSEPAKAEAGKKPEEDDDAPLA